MATALGHFALGHADSLGIAYAALISFDRRFVHRTIYISPPDGFQEVKALRRRQWHPSFREVYDMYRTNSQPNDAANQGLPVRSETNQTSVAAGSHG